jgi:hypothetical protein
MTSSNKHELKTLEDILRVVNAENIDMFLKDFSAWLAFTITLDALQDALDGGVGISQETRGTMNWIDDGKNDALITVSTVFEP